MLPVIIGPTSSGKTSLAIQIAKELGCEIISADSRQVFKYMNIGTGKVPVTSTLKVKNFTKYWTLEDVVVWGYDLVEPNVYFSAFDYFNWATKTLEEIKIERGKKPLLVGGTGFYIDLVTGRKSFSNVPPNFDLRKTLANVSLENLQQRLFELDPEVYKKTDINNPARLLRAIEVALAPSRNIVPQVVSNSNCFYIGLTGPRNYLYSRADAWVDEIWRNGLVEEVKNILNMGFKNTSPLNSIVYKTVVMYFNGAILESECIQRIKFDLHNYIRRQQTWFKQNNEVIWFDITEPNFFQKVLDHVQSRIDG